MRCRLVAYLATLGLSMVSCGGSAPLSVTRSTQTPVEDCRGSTETAPGGPSPRPSVTYPSLTVDNKLRDYRLFRPPALDLTKPVPLVVVLHGAPLDAARFEDIIHFDDQATKGRFLAASPNGCGGFWSYADGGSKVADQDFISEVISKLETEFPIDKGRVFVVGTSAGSWVAYRLACDLSDQIAAIASVAGTMRLTDDCQPARPVSILEMHGTEDGAHPWEGGGGHSASPVDAVIQRWTMLDRCVGDPIVTKGGITTTSVWSRCKAEAVVRLDKVVGGKHTWFGSEFNPVPGEPNANAVIWSFFSGLRPRT